MKCPIGLGVNKNIVKCVKSFVSPAALTVKLLSMPEDSKDPLPIMFGELKLSVAGIFRRNTMRGGVLSDSRYG